MSEDHEAEVRFNKTFLALLNDIKTELLVTKESDKKLFYSLKKKDEATRLGLEPTDDGQRRLVYKLEELGALKVELYDSPIFPLKEQREALGGYIVAPNQFYLHINKARLDELRAEYSQKVAKQTPVARASGQKITVRLRKDGLNLYLKSSDGQRIDLNRFRSGLTPEKLVDFLLSHPNTVMPLSELKLEGPGFASTENVAENLRKAGFTGTVKKYFLPESDSKKVRLVDEVEMDTSELEAIKAEIRRKNKSE